MEQQLTTELGLLKQDIAELKSSLFEILKEQNPQAYNQLMLEATN